MKLKILTILRLLLPKYYNRLTRSIIFVIVAPLLTQPIWIYIVNSVLIKYNYKAIDLEYNCVYGIIVLVLVLLYNSFHRYIEYKQFQPNEVAYKNVQQETFLDFTSMCRTILPIIKDNEYIFKHIGPNSGANESGVLRIDLSLWNTLKIKSIVPNNTKIKTIIEKNIHLVPSENRDLFNELILHIQAFEAHVNDANVDYGQNQFPKNITGVIENTCFNAITNSQTYQKIKKWMANKKKKYKIQQCYIIGSILMYPEQAKDVDIIVCTPNIKGILDNLNILEFDFKIEFNKTLHISYFEQNNQKYIDFCNRNKYKIEI